MPAAAVRALPRPLARVVRGAGALVAAATLAAPAAARAQSDLTYAGCDAIVCVTLRHIISAPVANLGGVDYYRSSFVATVTMLQLPPSPATIELNVPRMLASPPATGPYYFSAWDDFYRGGRLTVPTRGVFVVSSFPSVEGPNPGLPGTPGAFTGVLFQNDPSAPYNRTFFATLSVVPEPSTMALAAAGGLALAGVARRRARRGNA